MHVGPGDWLLACSDGLTGHVEDDELAQIVLANAADPAEAARRLIALANERGGSDNITLALAQPVPSDVSGELSIEAIDAAAAAHTSNIPVAAPEPASDSGADDELPQMEPIPHDDEWIEPRRGVHPGVWAGAVAVLVLLFVIIGFVWSQSYFLVERQDGHVGIDRGFPFARLATPYRSSETIAEDLVADDRERLVDSHRLLSQEDAERVLDELPSRLDAAETGGT
jgi:hypothetical protein